MTVEQKMKTKWCPKCEQSKLLSAFGKAKKSRDGHAAWCLKCTSTQWSNAQRNGRNRDKAEFRRESAWRAERDAADRKRTEAAIARLKANTAEVLGR